MGEGPDVKPGERAGHGMRTRSEIRRASGAPLSEPQRSV